MEKEEMKDTNTEFTDSNLKIYEVAFHIVPLVPEEMVGDEMNTIKNGLEKEGAIFISEESPKMRNLAYMISKTLDGHKHNFDKAYFGWVKFEMSPESILNVKDMLDKVKNILRFLIIETVRENTMSYAKPYFKKDVDGEEGVKREPEVVKELTAEDEELINKSIEELVKE